MSIVIATGCPHSGWEMVLPILQQAGLESASDSIARWHDEVLQTADITDPLALDQSLRPESAMVESAGRFLPQDSAAPLLLADSRSLWLLDFWAEHIPTAQFLLFYTRPEAAVAHALLQGVEPQQFLQGWQTASRQMLQFQRRHRRRALLLDAEAACRNPEALIEICLRVGIPLQAPPDFEMLPSGQTSVERLLAGMLVETQSAVQDLQAELEVSAHPLGDSLSPVQPQPMELLQNLLTRQVYERLAAERQAQLEQFQHENQTLTATHTDAVNENELLLLQLHQVQEELEMIFLQRQELEKSQQEHTKERQHLQAQIQELSKARDDQAKFLMERQSKLEKAQEEHTKDRQQLQAQLEKMRQNIKSLEATIEEMTQEKKALFQQLSRVQENLESTSLEKQRVAQSHQRMEEANKKAGQDKEYLLRQLNETRQRLQSKSAEVEAQQKRLAKLKQTASWKITAPVRAMAKPFKGPEKDKENLKKQIQMLKTSGLFDEKWYLAQHPDVVENGADPVEHYLRFGATEGRNPSPAFNTKYYLETHPDVVEAGLNPLVHYVKFGKSEGRQIVGS